MTINTANAGPTEQKLLMKGFRDYVREHLVPINNIVLAAGTLLSTLDFLVPRTLAVSRAVYTVTAALAVFLIIAAIVPSIVEKLLISLGYTAQRQDGRKLWRRPFWLLIVLFLVTFSCLGYASVAMAGSGGVIASQSKTVRSLQEELLSLHQDIIELKTGVASANAKLDDLGNQAALAREGDKRAVETDPASLGLVSLTPGLLDGRPTKAGNTMIHAAIYLNARGVAFSDIQLQVLAEQPVGKRRMLDLTPALVKEQASGAQTMDFSIPDDTRQLTVCMIAPYPSAQDKHTAVWVYTLNHQGQSLTLTPSKGARMAVNGEFPCSS